MWQLHRYPFVTSTPIFGYISRDTFGRHEGFFSVNRQVKYILGLREGEMLLKNVSKSVDEHSICLGLNSAQIYATLFLDNT